MLLPKVVLGFVLLLQTTFAYNQNVRCKLAKIEGAFVGDVSPIENQTCGQ